jgi:hypothetical protein
MEGWVVDVSSVFRAHLASNQTPMHTTNTTATKTQIRRRFFGGVIVSFSARGFMQ